MSDRHEACAERVHGWCTRAWYTQRDEHCEELAETTQRGQDAVQQTSDRRAILKGSIPHGDIGSCSCKGSSESVTNDLSSTT